MEYDIHFCLTEPKRFIPFDKNYPFRTKPFAKYKHKRLSNDKNYQDSLRKTDTWFKNDFTSISQLDSLHSRVSLTSLESGIQSCSTSFLTDCQPESKTKLNIVNNENTGVTIQELPKEENIDCKKSEHTDFISNELEPSIEKSESDKKNNLEKVDLLLFEEPVVVKLFNEENTNITGNTKNSEIISHEIKSNKITKIFFWKKLKNIFKSKKL